LRKLQKRCLEREPCDKTEDFSKYCLDILNCGEVYAMHWLDRIKTEELTNLDGDPTKLFSILHEATLRSRSIAFAEAMERRKDLFSNSQFKKIKALKANLQKAEEEKKREKEAKLQEQKDIEAALEASRGEWMPAAKERKKGKEQDEKLTEREKAEMERSNMGSLEETNRNAKPSKTQAGKVKAVVKEEKRPTLLKTSKPVANLTKKGSQQVATASALKSITNGKKVTMQNIFASKKQSMSGVSIQHPHKQNQQQGANASSKSPTLKNNGVPSRIKEDSKDPGVKSNAKNHLPLRNQGVKKREANLGNERSRKDTGAWPVNGDNSHSSWGDASCAPNPEFTQENGWDSKAPDPTVDNGWNESATTAAESDPALSMVDRLAISPGLLDGFGHSSASSLSNQKQPSTSSGDKSYASDSAIGRSKPFSQGDGSSSDLSSNNARDFGKRSPPLGQNPNPPQYDAMSTLSGLNANAPTLSGLNANAPAYDHNTAKSNSKHVSNSPHLKESSGNDLSKALSQIDSFLQDDHFASIDDRLQGAAFEDTGADPEKDKWISDSLTILKSDRGHEKSDGTLTGSDFFSFEPSDDMKNLADSFEQQRLNLKANSWSTMPDVKTGTTSTAFEATGGETFGNAAPSSWPTLGAFVGDLNSGGLGEASGFYGGLGGFGQSPTLSSGASTAASSPTATANNATDGVKKMLKDLHLEMYWPQFEEEGITELNTALALSDDEFKELGCKIGHRVKIKNWLNEYSQTTQMANKLVS